MRKNDRPGPYPKGTMQELFDDDPKTWCQGDYSKRRFNGGEAHCILGGVFHCYGDQEEQNRIVKRIQAHLGFEHIPTWNDSFATFADVKKLVKDLNI